MLHMLDIAERHIYGHRHLFIAIGLADGLQRCYQIDIFVTIAMRLCHKSENTLICMVAIELFRSHQKY